MSPRRTVNPAGRRRTAAALGAVAALAVGMALVAYVLAAPARTRVPRLTGLSRAAAAASARRAHLAVTFSHGYSDAAAGVAFAQRPRAGGRVAEGSRVHVVLSQGPAPVMVPSLAGQSAADAQRSLASLRLHVIVRPVPAPGTAPGTVTGQTPAGEHPAPVGSTVTLLVAETPRWRAVATFAGASSGVLHITGERWRVVYSMGYQGTCTFIFFCDGPTARVIDASTGRTVGAFGLSDGSGQTQTFATGPGTYAIRVTPGGDSARWSIRVEDWF